MRNLIALFVATSVAISAPSAYAQRAQATGLKFAKTEINLGKVRYGAPTVARFQFRNDNPFPIVIRNVGTYCGCLVATFTKAPIVPGKHGVISVTYDSRRAGRVNRTIHVETSIGMVELRLVGHVEHGPVATAPAAARPAR